MEQINPEENLARYILQKSHIRSSNKTVRYNAFLPAPRTGNTSVYRTTEFSNDEIWEIGYKVARGRQKTLHGRADILANDVIETGLDIDNDNNPKGHTNITSWPKEKSERMELAQELASNAQLYQK